MELGVLADMSYISTTQELAKPTTGHHVVSCQPRGLYAYRFTLPLWMVVFTE